MSLPPPPPGLFTTVAEGHLQKDMHGKTATGISGRGLPSTNFQLVLSRF
jgi:hypothetical protein